MALSRPTLLADDSLLRLIRLRAVASVHYNRAARAHTCWHGICQIDKVRLLRRRVGDEQRTFLMDSAHAAPGSCRFCIVNLQVLLTQQPNGWRYRQGRELAGKPTRRRIRGWSQRPESAGKAPHLSGARGVGQVLQDGLIFAFIHHCIYWWAGLRKTILAYEICTSILGNILV
jgi:hypothetical protein